MGTHELSRETDAAKILLANIADIVADDDVAREDAIEGETNFKEAVSLALDQIIECETSAEALGMRAKKIAERKRRLENRAEMMRAAIASALEAVGLKKMSLPEATLTLKPTPPKAMVMEEFDIPSDFFEPQPPKLDKRKLLAALKDGSVPGAQLSNGGMTLQIRGS